MEAVWPKSVTNSSWQSCSSAWEQAGDADEMERRIVAGPGNERPRVGQIKSSAESGDCEI